ncbi:MAG: hypothetical protein B7Y25_04365 [Alphaproteobacteria bacterium 16-39-46]|nr:MAG: hypothetical protein B7Y25_04365 [Alphaproteobacteria bacterium 16-39-46]OZA43055.1 MAG: hypothetical protein B7X84_04285 [Alphaproteobacteria bacterium 17-39-52]HQS84120.1 hypothetical protein [Alphaproteobacteria bacterium]HQS93834.1 hypothetical protein [Alphaproteobacteria bacterium]
MRHLLLKTSTLALLSGFFMCASLEAMDMDDEKTPRQSSPLPSARTSKKLLTHIQVMPFLGLVKQKVVNSEMNIQQTQADLEALNLTMHRKNTEEYASKIRASLKEKISRAGTISPEKTKGRIFLPKKNYVDSGVMGSSIPLEQPIDIEQFKTILFNGYPYFDRDFDLTQTLETSNGEISGMLQIGFTDGETDQYYLEGNLFFLDTKPENSVCSVAPLASEIEGNTLNITLIRPDCPSRQFFAVGLLPQ